MQELEGDIASRDNILRKLDELSSMAEKRSVVVIYFSGHGFQLEQGETNDKYFDQGILPADLTKEMVSFLYMYLYRTIRKVTHPREKRTPEATIPR